MLPMLDARDDDLLGGSITSQLVGDHHARSDALLLEKLAQQALGGLRVAAALDQDVEHDPVLVHGAPEPVLLAGDADHNLIKMPFVTGCRKTSPDLVGEALAELQGPLPHRLMADQDTSGGQHFLDHAQAERKPEVKPNGMADHLSREAVASIAGMTRRFHALAYALIQSPTR